VNIYERPRRKPPFYPLNYEDAGALKIVPAILFVQIDKFRKPTVAAPAATVEEKSFTRPLAAWHRFPGNRATLSSLCYISLMQVEKFKYIIWAKDLEGLVRFYQHVFDAEITHRSEVMAECSIAHGILAIHGGGEGERTWTGLTFQVSNLFEACDLISAEGGAVLRPPVDTPEEPAHLAMCVDPSGNEFMVTIARRKRA
jgi:lactoylglutathione lyase